MKIKVCKTYQLDQIIFESDLKRTRNYENFTHKSDYSSIFETVDVTKKELLDYIKKGYAIKINC